MHVSQADFLKDFYRNLENRPLEPDDPQYIELYGQTELLRSDPVAELMTGIE